MTFFDDSSLVALASELQLLNYRGEVHLSMRQRYAHCTDFLSAVKYFVHLNLAKHLLENDPAAAELARMAHELDWGVVNTLIGEDGPETAPAQTILAALFPHGAPPSQDNPARALPTEFYDCTWQRLYLHLDPQEHATEKSFDKTEAAQIIRFAHVRCQRGDRVTPALVEFFAARFRDHRRKDIIDALINCASEQPHFYQRVVDTRWMSVYYHEGGAIALARGLIAMLALADAIPSDDLLVELDERLEATLPSIKSRLEVIAALGRVARKAGICPELRTLLVDAANEQQWKTRLRDLAMPKGSPCTLTAQRLTCKLLLAYGMHSYRGLARFNRRIRHIQLEDGLDDLVITRLLKDKSFAAKLIGGKVDMKTLRRETHKLDLDAKYTALMLVSMAAFRGARLGAVTRGLSLLYRARSVGRIDEQHYGCLTEAIFSSLPTSLLLMDELPANIDGRLRRLLVPLLVAIELYDVTGGDQAQHISDAYYQLGQYEDPSERERPVQRWEGEWM